MVGTNYVHFVCLSDDSFFLTNWTKLVFGTFFRRGLSLCRRGHPERIINNVLADSAGIREKPSTSGQLRFGKPLQFIQHSRRKLYGKKEADNIARVFTPKTMGSTDYKTAKGVMRET